VTDLLGLLALIVGEVGVGVRVREDHPS